MNCELKRPLVWSTRTHTLTHYDVSSLSSWRLVRLLVWSPQLKLIFRSYSASFAIHKNSICHFSVQVTEHNADTFRCETPYGYFFIISLVRKKYLTWLFLRSWFQQWSLLYRSFISNSSNLDCFPQQLSLQNYGFCHSIAELHIASFPCKFLSVWPCVDTWQSIE